MLSLPTLNYGSRVRATFGMRLRIALVVHFLAVELHVLVPRNNSSSDAVTELESDGPLINATDEASQQRRGFVLGLDKMPPSHPLTTTPA